MDLSEFGNLREGSLSLPYRNIVWVEDRGYSIPALRRLITSSNRLELVTLWDNHRLPIDESQLQPILTHAALILKILKLMEPFVPLSRPFNFDISSFKALRLLHIEPSLLFVPQEENSDAYTSAENPDLAELIRRCLPPNVKVLLLESLTLPMAALAGMQQRDTVAPKLKGLFMYHGENMSETEELKKLFALAESMPVRMAGLYRTDPINFVWDWLDSDEDN